MSLSDFLGVDFGDQRINRRGQRILDSFFQGPGSSINGSFRGWDESKACYRFFENEKVTPQQILKPHKDATLKRIQDHNIILCIQDTTIVDYSHRSEKVAGLGKLRVEPEQGFLMHPTIAFSSSGLCLGVIENKVWTRQNLLGRKLREESKPIEEKESLRWLESYWITQEMATANPNKTFVNIADREGDFYELLQEYDFIKAENAHLLVRAKSDRTVEGESGKSRRLWDEVSKQKVACTLEFQMSSIGHHKNKKKTRQGRVVKQEIRVSRISLTPPQKVKRFKPFKPIELTAILCSEINPPNEEEKVEWLLLTTFEEPDETKIQEIIGYYVLRWQIELYFKILKSGCKIEELQLESLDRLVKCVSMYMIVSWRILFLSYLGRNCPELPCSLFYDESEWKAVYIVAYKKKPPTAPPSINAMNRIIASFGGFLNRKSDGEPGIKTMWIGLQRLKDFTLAYEIFQEINTCG
jgi:hypothetical protein